MLAVGLPAGPTANAASGPSGTALAGADGFASLMAEGEAVVMADESAAQGSGAVDAGDAAVDAPATATEGDSGLDVAPEMAGSALPFVMPVPLPQDQPKMIPASAAAGDGSVALGGALVAMPLPASFEAVADGGQDSPPINGAQGVIGATPVVQGKDAAPQSPTPVVSAAATEPVAMAGRGAQTPPTAAPDAADTPPDAPPPVLPLTKEAGEAAPAQPLQGMGTQSAATDEGQPAGPTAEDANLPSVEKRKLARSARLTLEHAPSTPPDKAPDMPAGAASASLGGSEGNGPQDIRSAPVAPGAAPRSGDMPAAPPAIGPDAAVAQTGPAPAGEGPLVQPPAEKPAPVVQTFEAHLAKAAEPPPPPRSPLVQAAVDRLAPLPATPGETVLRLNPHGLGLIEVVISEGRNGALDVALRVQNPLVLDAMRQEREAVAVVFSAPQGGAEGSLSMDLMQSGARQGGGGGDARGQPRQAGQTAADAVPEVAEVPDHQILSADRVNIVT